MNRFENVFAMKIFILLVAIAFFTGCDSNWVNNYDLSPNEMLQAHIEPSSKNEIVDVLRKLSKEHGFEIVVKNPLSKEENDILVLMRNRNFRIHCTNTAQLDFLQIGFYKAVGAEFRPSDADLATLGAEFEEVLSTVEGVNFISKD